VTLGEDGSSYGTIFRASCQFLWRDLRID
jgi:hypothetical protein